MKLAALLSMAALVLAGCTSSAQSPGSGGASTTDGGSSGTSGGAASGTTDAGPTFVPPDPQRSGDADAGYQALVNGSYIGCGVPYALATTVFGGPTSGETLPGRTGDNANLPYYLNAVVLPGSGVEVAAPNCLQCHAAQINGQLIVGLGNTSYDYTTNPSSELELAVNLVIDPAQKAEMQLFADRMQAIGPYVVTQTVGVNSADNLAAALFAHHDETTLAWSDAGLLPAPPTPAVPVRVPPWWRMSKVNAMFYNASGRGDHARIMMTASTLCTDTVAEATQIDAMFPDIAAYITSLQRPPYPFPINQSLVAHGQAVFESTCATCHGTYGAQPSYPNLLIPPSMIGTDPTLASAAQFGAPYVDWYNHSFYGQIARLDPQSGYIAPPLDGVWAIAPYFHNGSVPTLEGVLDSSSRPRFWQRTFSDTDYDQVNVGWNYTTPSSGGTSSI